MKPRRRSAFWVFGVVFVLPALVVAATHDVVVDLDTFQFNPATVTIIKGDIVRWTNSSDFTHTSTSGTLCTAPNGLWNATLDAQGGQFSRVFNEPAGTLPYFCIPHCQGGMRGNVVIQSPPTGVEPPALPGYKLHQNVPNPFSPTTVIEFEINTTARVEIEIYDVKGRRIGLIENDVRSPGRYPVLWSGQDEQGTPQATGVYFYQMKVDGVAVEMKKMMLLR